MWLWVGVWHTMASHSCPAQAGRQAGRRAGRRAGRQPSSQSDNQGHRRLDIVVQNALLQRYSSATAGGATGAADQLAAASQARQPAVMRAVHRVAAA